MVMANVPPNTPSFRNTCGKAKDPAPHMHLPRLVAADSLVCVPRRGGDVVCASESPLVTSQEETMLSPSKHGSSSTSKTSSIPPLDLSSGRRVVDFLWARLQPTWYIFAVGEKQEDSLSCRMMTAAVITAALPVLYFVILEAGVIFNLVACGTHDGSTKFNQAVQPSTSCGSTSV